jgi:hypothetical protein
MNTLVAIVCLAVSFLGFIASTPLDDYVWKYDENYKWVDMVSVCLKFNLTKESSQ